MGICVFKFETNHAIGLDYVISDTVGSGTAYCVTLGPFYK